MTSPLEEPQTVPVSPTETTVASFTGETLNNAKRITLQVTNLDATQTFVGIIYRRKAGMTKFAPSTIGDFVSIPPSGSVGDSVMVDLDVEGTEELELRGTMSGLGGNVQVGATQRRQFE